MAGVTVDCGVGDCSGGHAPEGGGWVGVCWFSTATLRPTDTAQQKFCVLPPSRRRLQLLRLVSQHTRAAIQEMAQGVAWMPLPLVALGEAQLRLHVEAVDAGACGKEWHIEEVAVERDKYVRPVGLQLRKPPGGSGQQKLFWHFQISSSKTIPPHSIQLQ